jgi:transcription elongation factor SPT4
MAAFDEDFGDEMLMDEELDDGAVEWAHANAPKSAQNLRACIPCLLVKSYKQFMDEGCENCSPAFDMKDDPEKIAECTTASFEGLMAMLQPEKSWVARWQFVQNFIPGVYAIKVKGEVSEQTERELAEAEVPNVGKMMQQEDIKLTQPARST